MIFLPVLTYPNSELEFENGQLKKKKKEQRTMDSVELGGRDVDGRGTNAGLIRCPRCMSRILSKCGTLTARDGDEQVLTLTPLL